MENITLEVTFNFIPVFGFALVFLNALLPVFRDSYDALSPEHKQYANNGLLLGLQLATVGLGFLGVVDVYDIANWKNLVVQVGIDFIAGVVTLNSTYTGTKYALDKIKDKLNK